MLAEAQPAPAPAPPAKPDEAPPRVPPVRDSREEFVPGDPLGTRFGGDSISGSLPFGDRSAVVARISASRNAGLKEGPSEEYSVAVAVSLALIIAGLALLAFRLYRRRGRSNFAGQEDR